MPRSEERRVGKECRSRCDWSSDVCSSDLRLFGFRALERLLQLSVTGRRERLRIRVVDELGLDAMVGAEDDQARALGRPEDLAADALVAALARLADRKRGH